LNNMAFRIFTAAASWKSRATGH